MTTIIPNQFFGIGDIIFTQTLVHRIAQSHGADTRIIWPCMPQFLDGLTRAYPRVTFVDYRKFQIDYDRKDDYYFEHPVHGRCRVLPLRWADAILKWDYNRCMSAKYALYGMDFDMWREEAVWVRDETWEGLLYKQAMDGKERQYTFGNGMFGSDNKLTVPIPLCDVSMGIISRYSLFDWAAIIENATEIHTVNTSIIYILECLDIKAPEVHLYQRSIKGQTFDNIKYLLKRHKYIFHG